MIATKPGVYTVNVSYGCRLTVEKDMTVQIPVNGIGDYKTVHVSELPDDFFGDFVCDLD